MTQNFVKMLEGFCTWPAGIALPRNVKRIDF